MSIHLSDSAKRRRWLDWQPAARILTDPAACEPTKPTKPGFDGFVGAPPAGFQKIEPVQVSPVPLDPEVAWGLDAMRPQVPSLPAPLPVLMARHKPDLLAPASEFVYLKGGLTLPVEALKLALDLEARGIPLATDAAHQFIVPTAPSLTEAEHAAIGRWRHHLGAIVEYQAPEVG